MILIQQKKDYFYLEVKGLVVASMKKVTRDTWHYSGPDGKITADYKTCHRRLLDHKALVVAEAGATPKTVFTVFTDASYHDQKKTYGGAWWGRGAGADRCVGSASGKATSSTYAEIITGLKGVKEMINCFSPPSGAMIVLVSDLMGMKQFMYDAKPHGCHDLLDFRAQLLDELDKLGLILKVNHVKAHRGVDTPRKWVNNFVDQKATEARLAYEKLVGGHHGH